MQFKQSTREFCQTQTKPPLLKSLTLIFSLNIQHATASEHFKCETPDGVIEYSDQQCTEDSEDLSKQNKTATPGYELPAPDISLEDIQGIWRDDPGTAFSRSWIFSGSQVTIATKLGYPSKHNFSLQSNKIVFQQNSNGVFWKVVEISNFSQRTMTLGFGDNSVKLYRQ